MVDTLKLSEQWDLLAGIRWDRFDADYRQTTRPDAAFHSVDQMPSYRGGIVYKPVKQGSIYVSYGTSFNPSAESLSLSSATAALPPEKNETYEVGTKWDLFKERLSLRGAVFQLEKLNARVPDPNNPLLNTLGGDQRVRGFEIETAGHLTEHWQIFSGYAFMDARVEKSTRPLEVGNRIANAPAHTFSLWTTYDLPHGFQIGGGINAVSSRAGSSLPDTATGRTRESPGYITADLMGKYHLTPNVDLQLNVINITDEYYIDQVHPAHLVPGEGRTAFVSTNFKF